MLHNITIHDILEGALWSMFRSTGLLISETHFEVVFPLLPKVGDSLQVMILFCLPSID